jgi:CheY-like chemotaxis protein
MMPIMDGVEATKIIREKYPEYKDVPIIAFTANAVGEARNMLMDSGMNDFVSKPVEPDKIRELLIKWLPEDKKRQ